ncbi:CotH kinase family protein [Cohnella soli]|uniref:CotH kinase family protein n=1 Tax=Cohnella soli TaxID=425005 RepID=A0ABW0HYR7_9BACL
MALPVRTLIISDTASEQLEKNLWNDQFVPCKMSTNERLIAAKVRYRGGHTRSYPKRSYEVVGQNQSFHYNAEYDDPSMIRNALSFAFFPMIGVPAPRTKHVMLRINGRPMGIYLEIEGVGRLFFRRRKIGASALFYAINNRADFSLYNSETNEKKSSLMSGYEYRFGDASEKTKLKALIRGINTFQGSKAESFIRSHIDVNVYLRWLAGAVLTGNYDGFEQNYALYRSRANGKLRMIPWDYEGSWGRNCYGRLVDADLVEVSGYNQLTRKLLGFESARLQYKRILQDALNGPFRESVLMPVVYRMLNRIAPYVREDDNRKYHYSVFQGESYVIRDYIRSRRSIVASELERL